MRRTDGRTAANGNEVLEHLPFLRRYARALTGSQGSGDGYVVACLETMLEDPQSIENELNKRDVFRLFHQVWNALTPAGFSEDDDADRVVQITHGLAALPAVERKVLLLTALEEFSLADTAFILGLTEDEVHALLSRARDDLLLEVAVDILIIEDEPLITLELTRIVESMGHRVCGTAARHQEAVTLALEHRPALILADIQLQEGESGILAAQEILTKLEMPVIFVTGFPERLLTGDHLEPAFVIAKPFNSESLQIAIGQALTVTAPVQANQAEAMSPQRYA